MRAALHAQTSAARDVATAQMEVGWAREDVVSVQQQQQRQQQQEAAWEAEKAAFDAEQAEQARELEEANAHLATPWPHARRRLSRTITRACRNLSVSCRP